MVIVGFAINTALAGLAAVLAIILYGYLRDRRGLKKPLAFGFAAVVWLILAIVKEAIMDYISYLLG